MTSATLKLDVAAEECDTCFTYLLARFETIGPHLAAQTGDAPLAFRLLDYMDKVHARHLAGDSIDFPTPTPQLLPALVDSPPTSSQQRRPCRACRGRKRRRGPSHRHPVQIGAVQ